MTVIQDAYGTPYRLGIGFGTKLIKVDKFIKADIVAVATEKKVIC